MKKLLILSILIALPLLILANASVFGFHKQAMSNLNPVNADRAFKLMRHSVQSWDSVNNLWIDDFNYVFHYPAGNPAHPDSVTVEMWDGDAGAFSRAGVYLISYNTSGDLITRIVMNFDFGGTVINFQDIHFSYTTEGYLIAYQMSMRDMTNMQMLPYGRMTITYTSSSNYESWEYEAQNEDNAQEWRHRTFAWDGNGRIIQETAQSSPDSSNWVNAELVTRQYLSSDNSTGADFLYNMSHQFPMAMLGDVPVISFGKVLEEIDKICTGSAWENAYKDTYDYNVDNLLMNVLYSDWFEGNWVTNNKNEYMYDNNDNVSELYSAVWGNDEWNNSERSLYDWVSLTSNEDHVSMPQLLNLSVYPNPFTENLSLRTDSKSAAPIRISVYNIKGELVRTALSKSNSQVSIKTTDLPTGLYLVKAKQGSDSAVIKTLRIK